MSVSLEVTMPKIPDLVKATKEAFQGMSRPVGMASLYIGRGIHDLARQRLNKDSLGHLRASWLAVPVLSTETGAIMGTVGSDLPYAAIHDEGGVIKPKGTLLAIPVGAQRRLPNRGPSDYENGHWWKNPKTGKILFSETRQRLIGPKEAPKFTKSGRRRKARKLKPMPVLFLGMTEVRIKPTHYITEAVETRSDRAAEIIGEAWGASFAVKIGATDG